MKAVWLLTHWPLGNFNESLDMQCCWNMVARSPNSTRESTGRTQGPTIDGPFGNQWILKVLQKIFRNETGHMVPQISCVHCTFDWIKSGRRQATQPSTMGTPLGEPGFCIFRSTGYVIFKPILVIDGWGISCEIALIWTVWYKTKFGSQNWTTKFGVFLVIYVMF